MFCYVLKRVIVVRGVLLLCVVCGGGLLIRCGVLVLVSIGCCLLLCFVDLCVRWLPLFVHCCCALFVVASCSLLRFLDCCVYVLML